MSTATLLSQPASVSCWTPAPNAFAGTIGVFDSGIGGLSVAAAIQDLLPAERMLYVADNAYAPYGPRPAEEIEARSLLITKWLLAAGAKMIVVACNTATSLAIDVLREAFPDVPFVGLEPAVKPAAAAERVGVLATAATLKSKRYQDLRQRYLANRPVHENPCLGLVSLIEAEGSGSPTIRAHLQPILAPMLADKVEALVLGCTHYPLIRADIEALSGPEVLVIDPAPAAARQVKRLLIEHRLEAGQHRSLLQPSAASCGRAHTFCTTSTGLPLQRTLLSLPGLNAGRKLLVPQVVIN